MSINIPAELTMTLKLDLTNLFEKCRYKWNKNFKRMENVHHMLKDQRVREIKMMLNRVYGKQIIEQDHGGMEVEKQKSVR